MKINELYEGWRNKLIPPSDIKELIGVVGNERMEMCNACEYHSKHLKSSMRPDDYCTRCGCTLSAKTKCLSCKCPMDYWKAVLTKKQEHEITQDDNEKEE